MGILLHIPEDDIVIYLIQGNCSRVSFVQNNRAGRPANGNDNEPHCDL